MAAARRRRRPRRRALRRDEQSRRPRARHERGRPDPARMAVKLYLRGTGTPGSPRRAPRESAMDGSSLASDQVATARDAVHDLPATYECMPRERLERLTLEAHAGTSARVAREPGLGQASRRGRARGSRARREDWRRLPFLTREDCATPIRSVWPAVATIGASRLSSGTTGNPISIPTRRPTSGSGAR